MKTVEQISRGAANFFDTEVRPSLSGGKGILYGVAVGTMLANPQRLIGKYKPVLEMMGIMDGEQVDIESVAAELKRQMARSGNVLEVRILGDEFRFTPSDVDNLLRCIEKT